MIFFYRRSPSSNHCPIAAASLANATKGGAPVLVARSDNDCSFTRPRKHETAALRNVFRDGVSNVPELRFIASFRALRCLARS
jgi:hypothetical protein